MNTKLQKASAFLKSKKYSKALEYSKKALKEQPKLPPALFIQAISYSELGNLEQSLKCFNLLTSLHPHNSEVYYNLGLVLEKFNKTRNSIDAYKSSIKFNNNNPYAHNNYANQLYKIGDFESAIKAYKQALQLDSLNIGFLKNLCKTLFSNKNFNQCIQQLNFLVKITALDTNDLNILIQCYQQIGNYRQSYHYSQKLSIEHPNDYLFHYLLGLSALKMCRYPIAVSSFVKSIELNKNHTTSQMNLAIAYSYLAKYKQANKIIDSLILTTNNDLDTIVFVCKLKEMQNEIDLDNPYFIDAITLYPNDNNLLLLKAKLLISSSKYNEASLVLNKVIKTTDDLDVSTNARYLLGNVFDKLKSFGLAWIEFNKANSTAIDSKKNDTFNNRLINSLEQIEKLNFVSPKDNSSTSGFDIIFIVGFPRSGTTLIDSILSCNPSSLVLEEVPLIDDIANRILENTNFDDYYQTLINLRGDQLQELRDLYINSINLYHVWENNEVIIDKSPINIFHILLIHLLFPKAPIVFAVRHPLDVCISCFMQNFRSSGELTNNFKSIESIAITYDNLLTIWDKTLAIAPLNYHYLYYESLTSDFNNQVKSLIEFVNFDWSDDYLKFHQHTKSRGMIHTPSYNQVNKPIHQNSQFRFHNYINEIEFFNYKTKFWQKYFKYT